MIGTALVETGLLSAQGSLRGVFGRAFIALDDLFDVNALSAIHDEVCLALSQMPTGYTGGSHRSMGIMPSACEGEALVDYQDVIRTLDDAGFATFQGLADSPQAIAIDPSRRRKLQFGEERDVPLSTRQMLWLKMRHRVYFPWKVYAELIPNNRWEDKCDPAGKSFTRHAEALFPKTIAFVKGLPFTHIGRCNVMGLEAHDHGTVHRDGDPLGEPEPFLTLCPAGDKRLYLYDEKSRERIPVSGRVVWFNDHDYHGVLADPFFRYSIRIDGVFAPGFRDELVKRYGREP
ncbi:MAG: hypothetical protein ABIT01_19675 [Thermoanaerobaculia bacterium]